MLCETCRFTERPGFVRARGQVRTEGGDDMIPCPDCGGQGIAHCCDGICEQPECERSRHPTPQGVHDGRIPPVLRGHAPQVRLDRALPPRVMASCSPPTIPITPYVPRIGLICCVMASGSPTVLSRKS